MTGSIRVCRVEFSYSGLSGSFRLGPVDVDLEPGKLIFWIGGNGSGKSTLARILAGEIRASSGEVLGLTDKVTYHHQALEENIFPTLTVSEHLRLLAHRGDELLSVLLRSFPELADSASLYPDQLSGGQLQLLAFAGMVLRPSKVWIFDEVLNHLDSRTSSRVMDWIAQELVTPNSVVVLITHDLAAVASRADLAVVFNQGRISHTLQPSQEGIDASELASIIAH